VVAFGRRGAKPKPNVVKRSERSLLCVGGTPWEKTFPQSFGHHLTRACAAICDDIERFGELLSIGRDRPYPSFGALGEFCDVLPVHHVAIFSRTRFEPYRYPPAIRPLVGRSGLFVEEIEEALADRFGPSTGDTEFNCYVLLNERDEARIYDCFKDPVFAEPPILVFGCPAGQFVLPRNRTLRHNEKLDDPLQCFIPTDEIILKAY